MNKQFMKTLEDKKVTPNHPKQPPSSSPSPTPTPPPQPQPQPETFDSVYGIPTEEPSTSPSPSLSAADNDAPPLTAQPADPLDTTEIENAEKELRLAETKLQEKQALDAAAATSQQSASPQTTLIPVPPLPTRPSKLQIRMQKFKDDLSRITNGAQPEAEKKKVKEHGPITKITIIEILETRQKFYEEIFQSAKRCLGVCFMDSVKKLLISTMVAMTTTDNQSNQFRTGFQTSYKEGLTALLTEMLAQSKSLCEQTEDFVVPLSSTKRKLREKLIEHVQTQEVSLFKEFTAKFTDLFRKEWNIALAKYMSFWNVFVGFAKDSETICAGSQSKLVIKPINYKDPETTVLLDSAIPCPNVMGIPHSTTGSDVVKSFLSVPSLSSPCSELDDILGVYYDLLQAVRVADAEIQQSFHQKLQPLERNWLKLTKSCRDFQKNIGGKGDSTRSTCEMILFCKFVKSQKEIVRTILTQDQVV